MTYEDALKQARLLRLHFPYRLVFLCEKEGVYDVVCGKTLAKANNMIRNGYIVYKVC